MIHITDKIWSFLYHLYCKEGLRRAFGRCAEVLNFYNNQMKKTVANVGFYRGAPTSF